MIAMAPAFLIGILAIFFAICFIIYTGLALLMKLRRGYSKPFQSATNRPIIDASMDEKLGKISALLALIVTAVVFYFISNGPTESGIIVLYGLSGIGILVGIASFVNSKSPLSSNRPTKQQNISSRIQQKPTAPNKETITKIMDPDGYWISFVGDPTDEFLVFRCPVCSQQYAVSKTKYEFIFECDQCKHIIQITHKPAIAKNSEDKQKVASPK